MVLITSTSRSHIESYIKWFQKLSSCRFLLMGNLAFVLPGPFTGDMMWAQGLAQWSMSEWGTAQLPGLEGIPCPHSSSLFRNQCPGLSPPCLKTSSNGSFCPRAAHHFWTAFTVRELCALGKRCLHSCGLLSPGVRHTEPHPSPYNSPSNS